MGPQTIHRESATPILIQRQRQQIPRQNQQRRRTHRVQSQHTSLDHRHDHTENIRRVLGSAQSDPVCHVVLLLAEV